MIKSKLQEIFPLRISKTRWVIIFFVELWSVATLVPHNTNNGHFKAQVNGKTASTSDVRVIPLGKDEFNINCYAGNKAFCFWNRSGNWQVIYLHNYRAKTNNGQGQVSNVNISADWSNDSKVRLGFSFDLEVDSYEEPLQLKVRNGIVETEVVDSDEQMTQVSFNLVMMNIEVILGLLVNIPLLYFIFLAYDGLIIKEIQTSSGKALTGHAAVTEGRRFLRRAIIAACVALVVWFVPDLLGMLFEAL
ncbi:hypothetical protein [uncultured Microscilla sp.]|uniref:hypothetical protein n=1 Tax=uncultured Microscilla sp. TaxID=432653 RepID=UPI0026350700|nr:hypothetical protein [uncultured Microscilla sp.]